MNSQQQNLYKADILIIDDTPENLSFLSVVLTQHGYDVRTAINGQMAEIAATTVVPDLILLDIMMPELNGYEVCQRLKTNAQTADVPIVFLSALNEPFDKVKAFTVGGADYITKPFQLEEVLVRIQNQLNLSNARREVAQLNAELERRVAERTCQLQAANARLLDLALRDTLTGLPNRVFFLDRLEDSLDRIKTETDRQFAILLLDCDRFKIINNSFGHLVGDKLLCAAARRLERCLGKQRILARLGGDEFIILLDDIPHLQSAIQVAESILHSFTHSFTIEDHEVFISASIGIVAGSREYEKPEHLLRDADTAMYRAKAKGKDCYQIFDTTMHARALQFFQIETELRQVINQQNLPQFIVHYQPIISLCTGTIAGFEALVRWQHPTRGRIPPVEFISVAEETGLIAPIGYWVLQQACQQLRQWQDQKLIHDAFTVSVNLSARQFAQPDLIEKIDQILTRAQFNPQNLKLEITESAIMDNTESAARILQQLRERQIQLSIDDFGTGYSSLSYLHAFPVDTLKVDKSFVQRLDGNPNNLGLIPAIMSIARSMSMNVIAEGIETSQQLAALRALNCDFFQGYLFSPPLEPGQAADLLGSAPQW